MQRAGPEILDDDIGSAAQIGHDLARFRPVEVDAEIALPSVLLNIVQAHVADVRQPNAADIATWGFDLDDVGTQVAKGFGAVRAC
jgi:hypothetical protein